MNGHLTCRIPGIYSKPLSSDSTIGLLRSSIVMNGSFISLDTQLAFVIYHISILFV